MLADGSNILRAKFRKTAAGASARDLPERPKIALALGSGAARGWSHIGIVKRLRQASITPDIIAGTSIGALVAGCEAAGGLDELENFARGLTRRRVFTLLDLPWRGGGLIGGNKLADLLTDSLGDTRIEDLKRPFAAIATELATGHEIWLNRGNLVEAMRASYALPGIFPPVKINGKWLIDGAVVNPIPVSVCRAMGARFVIAVNLNADTIGSGTVIQNPERVAQQAVMETQSGDNAPAPHILRQWMTRKSPPSPGISTTLVAAYTISQDRLARSRMAGDPPDLVINLKAPDVNLFDFDKADVSIEAGEQAAEKALPELEAAITALAAQPGY